MCVNAYFTKFISYTYTVLYKSKLRNCKGSLLEDLSQVTQ